MKLMSSKSTGYFYWKRHRHTGESFVNHLEIYTPLRFLPRDIIWAKIPSNVKTVYLSFLPMYDFFLFFFHSPSLWFIFQETKRGEESLCFFCPCIEVQSSMCCNFPDAYGDIKHPAQRVSSPQCTLWRLCHIGLGRGADRKWFQNTGNSNKTSCAAFLEP